MSVAVDDSGHQHPPHPNAALLASATKGFDSLFANDIASARKEFEGHDDPFHLMGLGVCAFLEAALGMESGLMTEATRCLALSEAGTRKHMRAPQPRDLSYRSRFHHGLEWEILNADAVVLLGLTHALSESYMGYLQCIYALNSAHSKFSKLYKTVFPAGLPTPPTFDLSSGSQETLTVSPSLLNHLSHKHSHSSLSSQSSSSSAASTLTIPAPPLSKPSGFFSKWLGGAASSTASLPSQISGAETFADGPVEDLIVAGSAFGFGLFNLVFSLLPKKIQGFAGFLGFQHDRKLALQALALSAEKNDVHSVFAGLALMTYHGAVLLFSRYQADEKRILAEYKAIVDKVAAKYPTGALWILNRAKIMRMSYNAEGAIKVIEEALKPGRLNAFVQADMLLLFEFAWTLLSQRRYQEAANAFLKITKMNSWSHATYYFIAAGCHLSLGNLDKAQTLLDAIPQFFDRRKVGGKDLPTEVFIKRKLAFYKEKQSRRGGDEKRTAEAVKISPAEEIAIFWNTHGRIGPAVAQAHIDTLRRLTPLADLSPVSVSSKSSSEDSLPLSATPNIEPDLDTPDELAIRALLLGINYRTLKQFEVARTFLEEASRWQVGEVTERVGTSTWVGGVAIFELAVLELKVAQGKEEVRRASFPTSGANGIPAKHYETATYPSALVPELSSELESEEDKLANQRLWSEATTRALAHLETALGLLTKDVDLASRLDSRIVMLRDQIGAKREMVGLDGVVGAK